MQLIRNLFVTYSVEVSRLTSTLQQTVALILIESLTTEWVVCEDRSVEQCGCAAKLFLFRLRDGRADI